MKYYPEIMVNQFIITENKIKTKHIDVTTFVRKKFKGTWYIIKIFGEIQFKDVDTKNIFEDTSLITLINRVLKKALKTKHWYSLNKNLKFDHVTKDILQLSEKIRVIPLEQLNKLNSQY